MTADTKILRECISREIVSRRTLVVTLTKVIAF